jgi:HEAT repeat protein
MDKPKRQKYGGRRKGTPNKNTAEIKALARESGEKALQVLVELLKDPQPSVRMAAADRLLDRGFGRPTNTTQTLDAGGNITEEISNLELARWVAHLLTKGIDDTETEEKTTTH